jgi:general stress protein YciG
MAQRLIESPTVATSEGVTGACEQSQKALGVTDGKTTRTRLTPRRTNRNLRPSKIPRRNRVPLLMWCGENTRTGVHSSESRTMNEAAKGRERKERRGFASMSPEKQREIASKGGRAAHQKGTAHEWTSDEARSAGRKGGQISRGGRGRLVEGPQIKTVEGPAGAGAADGQ